MPKKKKVEEEEEPFFFDEVEQEMEEKEKKAVVKEVVDTAVKESKERIKKYLELGKTLAPDLVKRAKKMGFEDPAEYLKSALDFYDYYRDKVEALEEELKQLRAELSLLSYLRPNIWKAYILKKVERAELLRLSGIITPEEFNGMLSLYYALLGGGMNGRGKEG